MIEVTELAPRALELVVRDKITSADVEKVEEALNPYMADEGAANAVVDLRQMTGMTLRGFFADVGLEGRLLAQMEKFGRVALVTESEAAAGLVRAFDAVMPRGSFRSFSGSQAAEARSFVSATATH
ncbi:hypothetical protein FIU94_04795 [Sulfitobacter sp. THAF37]|uniref:STAS/SEC14 domain-containing protein n=1 Tax=Sulfitobacter sp. THAF37 TaxID=2587855 RepID=UPI001268FC6C|nr:STAS/SEC14 domain-containing protein [Sulfitobacter sp. THAF37]QFT58133.1 hypothetical protein FIU94_04795 [Sulfitobacter sp. THAF37]